MTLTMYLYGHTVNDIVLPRIVIINYYILSTSPLQKVIATAMIFKSLRFMQFQREPAHLSTRAFFDAPAADRFSM